ncbi:hypothetical protein [Vibrio crassostreae]|uniref:hypothetical protein n=1 Tax=Vibrio crassostreae TaxID=246167 RepID=UPI001B30D79E|nr:hypothetical protein [Vibrio crassostreae]
MITIGNHLSNVYVDYDNIIDQAANDLWAKLNPKDREENYSENSMVYKLEKLISDVSMKSYIRKIGKEESERQLDFLNYLSSPGKLKYIVTTKSINFNEIESEVLRHIRPGDLYTVRGRNHHSTPFGELLLKSIFNYGNYRNTKHCYNRYKSLGFKAVTCPYCNENPIKIVNNDQRSKGESRLLFDLDHFYPKSKYPYLALSFFNHIPSCGVCNQTYKGSKDFRVSTHIHPFHRCFDSSYDFKLNSGVLRNRKITNVSIVNKPGTFDKLVDDLGLEERYKANVGLARIEKLVEILSKNSRWLRPEYEGTPEHDRLIEYLKIYGLAFEQSHILNVMYGKFQRDVTKMFDVNGTIVK